MAGMAAHPIVNNGDKFPRFRRAVTKTTTRQLAQLLSLLLCQSGGASRSSCHPMYHKIINMVAVPALPAVQFGDNFALCAFASSRLCVDSFLL